LQKVSFGNLQKPLRWGIVLCIFAYNGEKSIKKHPHSKVFAGVWGSFFQKAPPKKLAVAAVAEHQKQD
jgi:hypothetical protein